MLNIKCAHDFMNEVVCPSFEGSNLHFYTSENTEGYREQPVVKIKCVCEGCDAEPELQIKYHKGSIYLGWASKRIEL